MRDAYENLQQKVANITRRMYHLCYSNTLFSGDWRDVTAAHVSVLRI